MISLQLLFTKKNSNPILLKNIFNRKTFQNYLQKKLEFLFLIYQK